MNSQGLLRQLERLREREEYMKQRYNGNEQQYTFHGGWDLGYIQGMVRVLEDLLEGEAE